jgi:hypothetical protein
MELRNENILPNNHQKPTKGCKYHNYQNKGEGLGGIETSCESTS